MGHFPGSFAKIRRIGGITFLKTSKWPQKSLVLVYTHHDHISTGNTVRLPYIEGLRRPRRVCIVLHRFWKPFEVCPTFRFSLQRRPPEFAAIVSAKGLMIRNPTKYTIFGAMTDLKQACRNSLWEANSQDISTLYDSLTPSALYAESRNKLFFFPALLWHCFR